MPRDPRNAGTRSEGLKGQPRRRLVLAGRSHPRNGPTSLAAALPLSSTHVRTYVRTYAPSSLISPLFLPRCRTTSFASCLSLLPRPSTPTYVRKHVRTYLPRHAVRHAHSVLPPAAPTTNTAAPGVTATHSTHATTGLQPHATSQDPRPNEPTDATPPTSRTSRTPT